MADNLTKIVFPATGQSLYGVVRLANREDDENECYKSP